MSDQFVYFIQVDENGPIKIGFTADDPKRRLSQLQTGNPSVLKLLGAIRGSIARERQFHTAFAEWRLQGEWFQAHPAVLAGIAEALSISEEPAACEGPYCSFCGTCQHKTVVLIAGLGETYICAQCAGQCAKIAGEHVLGAAERLLSLPLADAGHG